MTETLPDPAMQWLARPTAIPQPQWDNFKVNGVPLGDAVKEYLSAARKLICDARDLSTVVHSTYALTPPPT